MLFLRITNSSDEAFKRAWHLYETSFPVYERRTLNTHINALDNENFYCTYIKDNNTFIGILFYWKLENYIYVEHFAINTNLRGQGYGSKALKEFCKHNRNLILEIDPPIDEISIKRHDFYKNIGFKLHNFEHIQLPYRKGMEGYKLKILSYGITLNNSSYNEFYKLMFKILMPYCEE